MEDLEEVLQASAALGLPAARALRDEYCEGRERAQQRHTNLASEFQVPGVSSLQHVSKQTRVSHCRTEFGIMRRCRAIIVHHSLFALI